jgi:hypothetical protein
VALPPGGRAVLPRRPNINPQKRQFHAQCVNILRIPDKRKEYRSQFLELFEELVAAQAMLNPLRNVYLDFLYRMNRENHAVLWTERILRTVKQ